MAVPTTKGDAGGFTRDAIEACLGRIAASQHFARSQRLRSFLYFTVEALLDGRAGDLKERTIGVEVYGRPLAYDPRRDPIVRSEAHRLRARLADYYEREGSADPLVIGLPKGSYVPELRPNSRRPARGPASCRLVVDRLGDVGSADPDGSACGALTAALRRCLAGWPGLEIVEPDPVPGMAPRASAHLEADFRVEGRVEGGGDGLAVTLRLVRIADAEEIWSQTQRLARKREAASDEDAVEALATAIAATLAPRGRRPGEATSRAHALYVKGRVSAAQYGNTLDPRHLGPAERRLSEALACEPGYVDALAELAHLELLKLYPPRDDVEQVLARARALLERALAAEPRHARSLYLLGHVEGGALRPREALRLTESAVAIDPDDAEGRTMLAVRYASLGFWESALAACGWAVILDPVWEAPYRMEIYLLTRMGRLQAARRAIDELARIGTSPTELAIARFDVRIAEGDVAGARTELASVRSTFALRPDQEDRYAIALGLARALEGNRAEARRILAAHGRDAARFWDHAIRLALVLDEGALARELLLGNAVNQSYRWLATEPLSRGWLRRPAWRALAEELHARWLRDLAEVGPRLPSPPPVLPEPVALIDGATPPPPRSASVSPT